MIENVKNEILKIHNLDVQFPVFGGIFQKKISTVHAVNNVSLSLIKGETLGIVGESGSGKSTLGNAVLNVLRLTAPEVKISGKIILNSDHNDPVGKFFCKPFRKTYYKSFYTKYGLGRCGKYLFDRNF